MLPEYDPAIQYSPEVFSKLKKLPKTPNVPYTEDDDL